MTDSERIPVGKADDAEITLGILNAIHENERITQRTVAQDLGIALGLANSYLKRCVKKGLVKVSQAPANRYAYYLTPQGFSEKSRLTAEYLSDSFRFFRDARSQCTEALQEAQRRGWGRIALFGASELAEVASLCEAPDVEIIAVVDPDSAQASFAHLRVVRNLAEAGDIDALILTALAGPQEAYEMLARDHPDTHVIVPKLLRVSEIPTPENAHA
ncbi:MAG: MarR family transcriptional regulator [Rhodospirillaceae bacterium]|nr:MarR family transcriptional regulator [Rhodospirillaceae bacterium]